MMYQPNTQNKSKKQLGNYIFGKNLGEGTFGKVKMAIHKPTGQQVAVKILQKHKIVDVADVQRVSRQIHILKLIRHPNIIQLYQIIETPKQLFLVMQYIENGQLFDYIVKNKKINQQQASKLFHQLISGIQYIHKLNIVHRDLKPQNLLLDYNKSLKIVDFGLSNTYKKNQTLKTPCGSPCYAAPEMIKGERYNGLNVDVWSSGVILFAMICGCLPFEDSNTSNLYKKILSGKYVFSKGISQEIKDLISKILTVQPDKRYTIQDIRNHIWMKQFNQQIHTSQGIIVGYNKIPIENRILKELQALGFQKQYVMKCLEANRHNNATTAYYLMFKKFLKSGGKSDCDISSNNFDRNLIEPNKRKQKSKSKFISQQIYCNYDDKENDKQAVKNIETSKIQISIKDIKTHEQKYHSIRNPQIGQKSEKFYAKINPQIQRRKSKQLTPANRITKKYRQQFNKSLISKSQQRSSIHSNNKISKPKINPQKIKYRVTSITSISKDRHRSQLDQVTNLIEQYNVNQHKRGRSSNLSAMQKKSPVNESFNGYRNNEMYYKRSRI